MSMIDRSYVGRGLVFLAPYTAGAGGNEVGNCSKLTLSHATTKEELLNYKVGGGGNANVIERITGVQLELTTHDVTPDNFAVGAFGTKTTVTATPVVAEAGVGYKGQLRRTAKIMNTAVAPVVTGAAGTPVYVAGTDYEVTPAGVIILATGSIADAATVLVSYTPLASSKVEAITVSQQFYKLDFVGLNDAQSGEPFVIRVHRFKPSPFASLDLISQGFGSMPISGEIISDATIVGAGLSKYYQAFML